MGRGKVLSWRPKKEDFAKRPSPVLYVFLILVFLISQFSVFTKASEAVAITKSSSADWDLGTNSNVTTTGDDIKLTGNDKHSWYSTGGTWNYRKKIVVDKSKVSGTDNTPITNFPVLVNLASDAELASNALDNGNDILFTSNDEKTKLSHEIESFDGGTGALIAWVKLPQVYKGNDTVFYMYYGNASSADMRDKTGVWSNGYAGVWHLPNGSSLTASDSTSNSLNGTAHGAVGAGIGKIYGGATFGGVEADYIDTASLTLSNSFTVEAWGYPDGLPGSYNRLVETSFADGFFLGKNNTSDSFLWIVNNPGATGVTGGTLANQTWSHVVGTYDGTTSKLYANGISVGTPVIPTPPGTYSHAVSIGKNINVAETTRWAGKMDEVRISTSARSASWIATEYNNQNDPATFYSLGSEVAKTSLTIASDNISNNWYQPSSGAGTDWKYRRKVTVDYTKVSADQYDFPMLVKITASDDPVFAQAQADGDDILFTNTYGDKLSHEIEKFDTSGKELWVWVNAPYLSSTVNTTLYMYYGNSGASSQQAATNVWANGYAGVWHLKDNAANTTVTNSTSSSGLDGVAQQNTSVLTTGGKAASAFSLNGSSDFVSIANNTALNMGTGDFSIETWAKTDATTVMRGINKLDTSGSQLGFLVDLHTGLGGASDVGNLRFKMVDSNAAAIDYTAEANIASGSWYHLAVTVDRDSATGLKLFSNGAQIGTNQNPTTAGASISNTSTTGIGTIPSALSNYLDGMVDEVRISKVAHSTTWISTEYNNQNAPETFYSLGGQQGYYPVSSSGNWYNSSWSYRQKITIDHTKVTADQQDFPTLISFTSSTSPVFANSQADGDDILFTSSNGTTKLSHELEAFTPASVSKDLIAWVKVPALSSSTDTVLYMYYGNASATSQQDKTGLWSAYTSAWHMAESSWSGTSGEVKDAKGNYNGTSSQSATTTASGIYREGLFNGTLSQVNTAMTTLDSFTVEGWVVFDGGSDYGRPISVAISGASNPWWFGEVASGPDRKWRAQVSRNGASNAANGSNIVQGTRYHVALTYNSTTDATNLWVNGVSDISFSVAGDALATTTHRIGNSDGQSGRTWNGKIDELKISPSVRSDTWLRTEYNNLNSPSTFYAVGNEEIPSFYSSPSSVSGGSGIIDTGWNFGWGTPNGFTSGVTIPANTSITFYARSSAVGGATDGDWTSWQSLGNATSTGTFSVAQEDMPVGLTTGANKYLQVKAIPITSDGAYSTGTPTLSDYTINYLADVDAPTNPTTATATIEGNPLVSGGWSNTAGTTNFTFSGATDSESGVAGYYTYLGTSNVGDPVTYQAHTGAIGDNQSFTGSIADGGTYYFRVKTKDNSGNTSSAATLFSVGCDTTAPVKPNSITANPAGYVSTNSFDFSWPDGTDIGGSGVKWYEYKRATDPAWSHTADSATKSVADVEAYQEGANAFYVRTVDIAGNPSSTYTQVTYYWSGEAPPKPDNVAVDPPSDDTNSFTISWDKPDVGTGSPIVGYYYSINVPPTLINSTYVASTAAHVTVGPDKYATKQGENTVYVVSKDEANNSSFLPAYYATATFSCQTAAPPAPTSVSIYDSSDKVEPRFMLTIQWQAGVGQDAGTFDHYSVERSTNGTDYSELATVSSGTSYLDDSSLSDQTTYYYRIKTIDNAASSSAASSVVSKQPSGKYTTAPAILANPEVDGKATQATITWTTDRASSSFVRYGTTEGQLEESKGDFEATTNHSVTLLGLSGSTKYYFQVQSVDVERDYSLESAYSTTYSFITLTKPSISNVSVSSITLSSADISWDTTTVASSRLNYGKTTSYGTTVEDISGQSSTRHSTKITGLDNSSSYHFKIVSTDIDGIELTSDDYSFETLPMPKISNLKVEEITGRPTQAIKVRWETNVPTSTIVRYGAGSDKSKEKVKSQLEKSHEIETDGLSDDSSYSIIAEGVDQFGNTAVSEAQTFKTKYDTRKAVISEIQVESNNVGQLQSESSQMVVSWKTDEPTTSQVLYGEGLSGETTSKSLEDTELKTNHLVIVGNLKSNAIYSFRVISKDKAGNETASDNQIIVAGESRISTVQKIINALNNLFGNWVKI